MTEEKKDPWFDKENKFMKLTYNQNKDYYRTTCDFVFEENGETTECSMVFQTDDSLYDIGKKLCKKITNLKQMRFFHKSNWIVLNTTLDGVMDILKEGEIVFAFLNDNRFLVDLNNHVNEKAKEFFSEKNFEKAIKYYSRSMEVYPEDARPGANIVSTYQLWKKPKKAIAASLDFETYYREAAESVHQKYGIPHNKQRCNRGLAYYALAQEYYKIVDDDSKEEVADEDCQIDFETDSKILSKEEMEREPIPTPSGDDPPISEAKKKKLKTALCLYRKAIAAFIMVKKKVITSYKNGMGGRKLEGAINAFTISCMKPPCCPCCLEVKSKNLETCEYEDAEMELVPVLPEKILEIVAEEVTKGEDLKQKEQILLAQQSKYYLVCKSCHEKSNELTETFVDQIMSKVYGNEIEKEFDTQIAGNFLMRFVSMVQLRKCVSQNIQRQMILKSSDTRDLIWGTRGLFMDVKIKKKYEPTCYLYCEPKDLELLKKKDGTFAGGEFLCPEGSESSKWRGRLTGDSVLYRFVYETKSSREDDFVGFKVGRLWMVYVVIQGQRKSPDNHEDFWWMSQGCRVHNDFVKSGYDVKVRTEKRYPPLLEKALLQKLKKDKMRAEQK